MYVIVVGGGKVGYYLSKQLLGEGHEVLLLEKDRRRHSLIAEELGFELVDHRLELYGVPKGKKPVKP